jgi:hypothetical protein
MNPSRKNYGPRRITNLIRAKAAKSMRLGGGGRFAALVKGGMSPALAAHIGRRKYGAQRFAEMSRRGRNRGK